MFRSRLGNVLKTAFKVHRRSVSVRVRHYAPVTLAAFTAALCEAEKKEEKEQQFNPFKEFPLDKLEHEFLIRQATTISVNAATQLLTVTLVAIQDTSARLREALTKEICLVQQALEWGEEGTPPHHWDQLVAVRGSLCDLNHNLQTLVSYMDYAEKLATVAAEISYLSGNIAASDAICERIDHACRTCNVQKQLTHDLQQASLEVQQQAILSSPQLEEKLKDKSEDGINSKNKKPVL